MRAKARLERALRDERESRSKVEIERDHLRAALAELAKTLDRRDAEEFKITSSVPALVRRLLDA